MILKVYLKRLLNIATFLDENNIPLKIREEYDAIIHKATECITCGNYEARCPFDVKVKKQLNYSNSIIII